METASLEDLQLFIDFLAGKGMPTRDTKAWFVRCQGWVKQQIRDEKSRNAQE